jgi:beta-lactam-binding protein with PASTA domain
MRFTHVLAALIAAIATPVLLAGNAMAASVPDVTGKKFSEAESALSTAGFKVLVASTVGDKLQRSDCMVVSQRTIPAHSAPYEVSSPPGFSNSRVALALNCNAATGKAKSP